MTWRNECTANFLGPFQRIVMDFKILMVQGRPQDRCVGRVAWKDGGDFVGA